MDETANNSGESTPGKKAGNNAVLIIGGVLAAFGMLMVTGALLYYAFSPHSAADSRSRVAVLLASATPSATPTFTPPPTITTTPTSTPTTTITPTGVPPTATVPPTPTYTPTPLPIPDGIDRSFRVPILMYHYVSVPPDDADIYREDLSVTPANFEEQMAWLAENGYETITVTDLVYALNIGWPPLPDKPIIITFDDGYVDNYQHAFPILQDYGLIGTFFILTDVTDREQPGYMSWDMMREMVAAGHDIQVHGREHVEYSNRDADWLLYHLRGPVETIRAELGYTPRIIAYTAGKYDDLTIQIVSQEGYWAGLTTEWGAVHTGDRLLTMMRLRVRGDWDLATFEAVIRGE